MKAPMRFTLFFTVWTTILVGISSLAQAEQDQKLAADNRRPIRKYRPYVTPANPIDTRWAASHGPWDFSGLLGFYNPGYGFGGRLAYRVMGSVLDDVDDSLSIESGASFVAAQDTFGGQQTSYTLIEIPFLGRWDFRIKDTKFIAGPNLGFSYLAGSNVTVNGVGYSTRGGGLYFEIGGQAMYRVTEKIAVRAQVDFGGYTMFGIGVTYFP